MSQSKPTTKSGSKEKKVKIVSKEGGIKAGKSANTNESSVAKIQEKPTTRVHSKKDGKISTTSASKASESVAIDGSKGTSLASEKPSKKSKTKAAGDSLSKPPNSEDVVPNPSFSSSKKRAREEPATDRNQAALLTKRKKVEQGSEEVTVKPPTGRKKGAKAPSPTSDDSEDISGKEVEGEGDDEVYLHGFSTDEDSSDDDEDVMEQDPLEVKNLPSKVKDDAEVKRRLDDAKKKPAADQGVLYIGRIPHGFYEEQMKEYFSQFGNVTRLRLARNKKTGRSKHYGFIEFDSSSVATIVSETMNNYLLAGHLLQCKLIATEKLHPDLWVGSNKKWKLIPKGRIARLAHNKTRTPAQQTRAEQRLLKRQTEKEAKLKAAGINYSLSKVGYVGVFSYPSNSTTDLRQDSHIGMMAPS